MSKYWKHFKTITKHKLKVAKHCAMVGIPLRGLLHDASKYGFTEFISSARYFQGTRSPIDAEKEDKGYSAAWQHHKGHNPHHWEYWIDEVGTCKNTPLRMPWKYALEMVCDWMGAGQVYSAEEWTQHEPWAFYKKKKRYMRLHPDTQAFVEKCLKAIDEKGLEVFYEYGLDWADEYDQGGKK